MTTAFSVQVAGLSIDDDSGLVATGHSKPRLSWKLVGSAAVEQQGYEIEVAADPGFDGAVVRSGFVPESRPCFAPWPADPLRSREVRWWRIRAHTNLGVTPWSAPSRVEASLLEPSDWIARPISPISNLGRTGMGPPPLVRRDFHLDAPVASARLYVTALGLHEVRLNGRPVSADLLEPGWSVYPQRLLFAAYDVTSLAGEGPNALAVTIGDGWFRGDLTWLLRRNTYGDTTAVLAQLEVTLADGRTVTIGTDSSWRGGYGEVRMAEIYHGADVDLRLAQAGWREAGFDDGGWEDIVTLDLPQGLQSRDMPAVRVVDRRELAVGSGDARIIHLDAGQNLTGYLVIKACGPAGATVTVRHAEVLDQAGELLTAILRKARATDTYILDGAQSNELAPPFTFHGFRYAEIRTSPGVTIEAVTVEVVATDLRRTGRFACSNSRLNQLFENVFWSQRGNFLALPTDCPQRDERLGWTGDIQVFAPTACLNADCRSFLRGWLQDLVLEQRPDGCVPVTVPNVISDTPFAFGSAAWADAAVITPWDIYRAYGDLDAVRLHFPSMTSWVDWCVSRTEPDGTWTRDFQFGDWLDPDAPAGKPHKAKTPYGFVCTSYLAFSARLVSRAAALLGETDASTLYEDLSVRTAKAAWDRWADQVRRTPTGLALAIQFGIAPADQRLQLGAELAAVVAANGYRIGTGFVGTPLVLPALADTGQLETAYRLLLNREIPGWLYPVEAGATTIWERWDAIRPDGSVNLGELAELENSMVSFNHYAYGAVAGWLYTAVAGLKIDFSAAPHNQITLAPNVGGDLSWAEAEVETPYGALALRWDLERDVLVIKADIPSGATARLVPPPGFQSADQFTALRIGSGRHTRRFENAKRSSGDLASAGEAT